MPDWREEYAPEYDSPFGPPDNEHPIAKLYRTEWEAEKRALVKINGFLDTITPADTQVQLFTFAERKAWGLRVNARRSVRG